MKSSFWTIVDDIKKQVREQGCSLTKLPDSKRANILFSWLKENLPRHLDVWIIKAHGRENEVNVFRVSDSEVNTKGTDAWGNSGASTTGGVPSKFKKWKQKHF